MGIKKKSKVSAEFNMSSLTDIIFLLLIFFMLTSSMVTPNALNLQLPGKSASTPPSSSKMDMLKIERYGTYYWNGTKVSLSGVEQKIKSLKQKKGNRAMVTVSPHSLSKNDKVVAILDALYRYSVAVTLTEPR
ncbi:MAG: biopolymer transporter ExbD [Saprospiraceae bacterium]